MKKIFHLIRRGLIRFNKLWMRLIPKNNNLILFTSWFGEKYADSSMYLYEYMLKHSKYSIWWYTVNDQVYKDLIEAQKPVVHGKTLRGIWLQIRAKVLITSVQMDDFNPMFYFGAILLDLDHGFPVKQVGFLRPQATDSWKSIQLLMRKGISFYLTASSPYCIEQVCAAYEATTSQVIYVNKPRIDALFDTELQKGKNINVNNIKNGRRAFVWMPTHRSSGKISMDITKIVDLEAIQILCEKHNVVFIIKKHFYHRHEISDLSRYPNIYDLTNDTTIDTQILLSQADVLISDYSACYIDYLALNRPIILFCYDLEEYLKKERGLLLPFEENTAGDIIKTNKELLESMIRIINDPIDSNFASGRLNARNRYFGPNIEFGTSRAKVKEIIDQLILESL